MIVNKKTANQKSAIGDVIGDVINDVTDQNMDVWMYV